MGEDHMNEDEKEHMRAKEEAVLEQLKLKKTKWTTQNFFESLKCACDGIKYVFGSQRNIFIQSIFAIIAIGLGLFFYISNIEWIVLSFTIALVIFAEFNNTSIETTVDLITEEYNQKAKIAKDVAAGAVLITALNSIIVGIIIFGERIINLIF